MTVGSALGGLAVPTVIDTDIDVVNDDGIALLVALGTGLNVVGVNVVAGNASVEQSLVAARRLLQLAGRSDIVVGLGASSPLQHRRGPFEEVSWGAWSTTPTKEAAAAAARPVPSATEVLQRTAAEHGRFQLLLLGPMTNIALALEADPTLAEHIVSITAVGGALGNFPRGAGNHTPTAEFNIWVDPEAADQVLRSGIDIHLVTLNCLRSVRFEAQVIERILVGPTLIARELRRCLEPVVAGGAGSRRYEALLQYGLADATAVAYLAVPHAFGIRRLWCAVDCAGGPAHGSLIGYELEDRGAVIEREPEDAWYARCVPWHPPACESAVRTTVVIDASAETVVRFCELALTRAEAWPA